MPSKQDFQNSLFRPILRAATVALVIAMTVNTSWAQSSVPPTAREAAAMPAFASPLHPSTAPAANKSPGSTRSLDHQPMWPYGGVIYENGPVNGTVSAWEIDSGSVVSNSFVMDGSQVIGFDFWVWEDPGAVMTSVDWSITSDPNGGTVYGSGTAKGNYLTDQFVSTNQYGYAIDKISVELSGVGASGTVYLNLQNAASNSYGVFWDENSGAGCESQGCPSQAYESWAGTIPSETFDILSRNGCDYNDPQHGFQIIHSFTATEQSPEGVVPDQAGNLYGATTAGGASGSGLVYELSPKGQDSLFAPLYSFTGGVDGVGPMLVIVGPAGVLYGTAGGGLQNCNGKYCGLIFNLRPSPTACLTALCSWTENLLYSFSGNTDAWGGAVSAVDGAGNLYGTSSKGGAYGHGAVFELTPSNGGWTERILYSFTGGGDGDGPTSLLVGNDGNLYGTTSKRLLGGDGVVFQLVPSGGSWVERVISGGLYSLIQDNSGAGAETLYGLSSYQKCFPPSQDCAGYGLVYSLTASDNGQWELNQVWDQYHARHTEDGGDIFTALTINAVGDLYGSGGGDDVNCLCTFGYIFRLHGGYYYELAYFGGAIFENVIPAASGKLYGTTAGCGKYGNGTAWELTPKRNNGSR